jgi:hypothetical protein
VTFEPTSRLPFGVRGEWILHDRLEIERNEAGYELANGRGGRSLESSSSLLGSTPTLRCIVDPSGLLCRALKPWHLEVSKHGRTVAASYACGLLLATGSTN